MKILAVGGGSGGHVTPVVAVISELQKQLPDAEIRFWCDANFIKPARETMHHHDSNIRVDTIISGKYRRYYNIPLWRQLLQFRTIVAPNIIDTIKIVCGTIQSIIKMWQWQPDVVFTKGGYVCLPVGIAARALRVPLVIHDSDAHPGLTNRILAKWADAIATGAPLKYYNYPKSITTYIGTPVMHGLKPLTSNAQQKLKLKLGFAEHRPLVVVTGGGLGAQRLNDATVAVIKELTAITSLMLVSGSGQYDALKKITNDYIDSSAFQLHPFISDGFQDALGAADIVVSRAGATTLLELAALGKPTVLVPNANLTGGHQLKNAAVYEKQKAAVVLDEKLLSAEPLALLDTINALLLNTGARKELAENIVKLAKPHAAQDMASLIIATANARTHS